MHKEIDWQDFISTQDMLWDEMPVRWENAPFLGNGLVGAMIYASQDSNFINLDLSRSDIGKLDYPGRFRNNIRLQIGLLRMQTKGKILWSKSKAHLSLWDATLYAEIVTTEGSFSFQVFASEDEAAFAVKLNNFTGGESVEWSPYFYNKGYLTQDGTSYFYEVKDQQHHSRSEVKSGGHVLAWTEMDSITYISIHSSPATHAIWNKSEEGKMPAMDLAIATQQRLQASSWEKQFDKQTNWWHEFYPKSFVSFENKELENYYWIQLYKLGSTARKGYPMIDNHGVWSIEPVYGFATWDLNVQLIYQLHLKSNHFDLGEPLIRFMDDNFNKENMWLSEYEEMRAGLRQQTFLRYHFFDTKYWEHDSLSPCDGPAKFLWGCHNYFLQYEYTMDTSMLPKLRDMLEGGINATLAGMVEENGVLVVPHGHSWESWKGKNPNGILAVLRWALKTIIEVEEKTGYQASKDWAAILAKITPYELGENGFQFGKNKDVYGHRHWSHLLHIYPLKTFDVSNDSNYKIAKTSIDFWANKSTGLNGEKSRAGYAPCGAMCLYAQLGLTEKIPALMDVFLYGKSTRGPNVWPSTMYREYGPVIETPLFFAASLQELILQSREDELSLFPAWSKQLGDVVFDDWRAKGGLILSSEFKDGKVGFVKIKSEVDIAFKLRVKADFDVSEDKKIKKEDEDLYRISLKAGEEVLLNNSVDELVLRPIESVPGEKNLFGWNERFLKKRKYIKEYQFEGKK